MRTEALAKWAKTRDAALRLKLNPIREMFEGKRVLDLGCGFGWHCRYAVEQGAASVVGVDVSDYVVKQVFYESKDGTKVPMFIAHKRGLKLDGKRPTLLYGYGGFNIALTPSFSVTRLA